MNRDLAIAGGDAFGVSVKHQSVDEDADVVSEANEIEMQSRHSVRSPAIHLGFALTTTPGDDDLRLILRREKI